MKRLKFHSQNSKLFTWKPSKFSKTAVENYGNKKVSMTQRNSIKMRRCLEEIKRRDVATIKQRSKVRPRKVEGREPHSNLHNWTMRDLVLHGEGHHRDKSNRDCRTPYRPFGVERISPLLYEPIVSSELLAPKVVKNKCSIPYKLDKLVIFPAFLFNYRTAGGKIFYF